MSDSQHKPRRKASKPRDKFYSTTNVPVFAKKKPEDWNKALRNIALLKLTVPEANAATYDDDEQMLEILMRMMPQAFLYDYDGVDGNFVRLKFRPDPSYKPPNYEARVVHGLAGTVLIDPQQQRLAKLSGRLINSVQFGWGIFGHIDNGGTIEVGRVQVGPSQWKTALLNIQLSGRLIFFKTINKQRYEVRSNFRAVPGDLSLADANDLLVSPILHSPDPEIRHGDPATTSFNLP